MTGLSRYMTLGTADAGGVPWVSPVWFAPDGPDAFLWVSDPDSRHSRNIAARPQVAIVIFNSTVEPGHAKAVYMEARAGQTEHGIEAFSAHGVAQGLREWTRADVVAPARHRLYRATVTARWELGPGDRRLPLQAT